MRFEITCICNFIAHVKRGHFNFSSNLFFFLYQTLYYCELKQKVHKVHLRWLINSQIIEKGKLLKHALQINVLRMLQCIHTTLHHRLSECFREHLKMFDCRHS